MALNSQPNDGDANGAIYTPLSLTFANQSRCSSSTAHYRPVVGKRPNFHLIAGHSVTKILIDKMSMQATGVNVSCIQSYCMVCSELSSFDSLYQEVARVLLTLSV